MTRIITLCSGIPRAGKTHLAVNLALEMVRRGRQAAVFNQSGPGSSIDELLALSQAAIMQRRSTDRADTLVRRGYQGIDILSSGIPVPQWDRAPRAAVDKIIADMGNAAGCDDFLVDTSGMGPRTVLACCRASPLLLVVITADARSRAEAFALLRILQLNGFAGEAGLLVNQCDPALDANELYHEFNRMLYKHLGLDIPLLGTLVKDVHVRHAERAKQAFTSLFPDAGVSAQIVAIADAIDAAAARANTAVLDPATYWNGFCDFLVRPVSLPGGVLLEAGDYPEDTAAAAPPRARQAVNDVILLQLESSFHALADALDSVPGLLQAAADDVSNLRRLLEASGAGGLAGGQREIVDSSSVAQLAVGLIREIEQAVVPARQLQLQVSENRVQADDPDWLEAGDYLKTSIRFDGGDAVLARIRPQLEGSAGFRCESGAQGETLWEMVVADRSGGLNIVHSVDDSIRLQFWLPLRHRLETTPLGRQQARVTTTPGKTIH